ncbi:NAD(P)-binding protein, partial [bacterium]|nr:NAD(P)-binding protein [bacterium]
MNIGIIGGGITGNYIQKKLQEKGISSLIFEKETEPGGLAKLIDMEGHKITLGPHIYPLGFLKKMNLFNYAALDLNEGFIYNNKFLKSNQVLKYFPEIIFTPFKMLLKYSPKNMNDFSNFYFGKKMTENFLKPLFEKWIRKPLKEQSQVKSFLKINFNLIFYY